MKTILLHIRGITPLLMHSTKGMLEQKPGGGRKHIPTPEEEAEKGAYRDADGDLYVPCIFFRQAAVSAGKGWKRTGKRVSLSTELKGALFDPDRQAKLTTADGEVLRDYEVDKRPVVVQKARVIRGRARLREWYADVLLDYDPDIITPANVVEVLEAAGSRIGVGDYRPEKGGWFGRFEVLDCVEVDND